VAGYVAPSTIVTVSTGSVRVHQSTATDLLARVNQGVGNSSAGDRWRVNAANSSAVDYIPVRFVDSSGTGFLSPGVEFVDASTASVLSAPGLTYSNSSNDTMRLVGVTQPLPVQVVKTTRTLLSVSSTITSTASTAFYALVAGSASTIHRVFAYSITSTAVTPMAVEFLSATNTVLWGVDVGSASSGVTGANLAVTPPGSLFQTAASAALNIRLGSTGVQVRISAGYFSES
jgi:hypothetical protein